MGVCLYLFIALKREIRVARKRHSALRIAIEGLRAEIGEMKAELAESGQRSAMLAAPAPFRSGLNLSTRSQALRMFRRGSTNQQIAAALGIPEKEVELLLKVQRIVRDMAPPAEDAAAEGLSTPTSGLEALLKAAAAHASAAHGDGAPAAEQSHRTGAA